MILKRIWFLKLFFISLVHNSFLEMYKTFWKTAYNLQLSLGLIKLLNLLEKMDFFRTFRCAYSLNILIFKCFLHFSLQVDSTNTLVQTPKKYSKNSNRDLLRSGQESALATEQGRLWIKEVAASSEIMKIPKDIVIDDIYTPWSRWSRCRCKRKGAKQVRRRRCAHPAICGRNVIKVNKHKLSNIN